MVTLDQLQYETIKTEMGEIISLLTQLNYHMIAIRRLNGDTTFENEPTQPTKIDTD